MQLLEAFCLMFYLLKQDCLTESTHAYVDSQDLSSSQRLCKQQKETWAKAGPALRTMYAGSSWG